MLSSEYHNIARKLHSLELLTPSYKIEMANSFIYSFSHLEYETINAERVLLLVLYLYIIDSF